MASSAAPSDPDLYALAAALEQTSALLRLLRTGLEQSSSSSASQPSQSPSSPPKPAHPPLAVLATAATLLRNEATRLSLLSLHPPFTPTALTTCLKTLPKVLPAFAAAWSDLRSPQYPPFVAHDVRARVLALYAAVEAFLGRVPRRPADQGALEAEDEHAGDGVVVDAAGPAGRRKVLRGTGVVWAACDWFVDAKAKGVAGLARARVLAWKALASDALDEMGEWVQGGGDAGSGSEDDDDGCPEDMRPLAQSTLLRVRSVLLLYQILLGKADDSRTREEQAAALDARVALAKAVSERIDEVAGALYELDEELIVNEVRQLREAAVEGLARAGVDEAAVKEWLAGWDEAR